MNIANETARMVVVMDTIHQELIDKYKSINESLEKKKPKKLHLQEGVKKLEQNVAESRAANLKLVGDLEAKEEEVMSLNE